MSIKTQKTMDFDDIVSVEAPPSWPFPKAVGGIPIRSSALDSWKASMQAKTQTIKRCFPDSVTAQRVDFENMHKHIGEALL